MRSAQPSVRPARCIRISPMMMATPMARACPIGRMMPIVRSPPGGTPSEAPAETIPAAPSPVIIIGITPPAVRIEAPVPPQAVAERREYISIQPVSIYIPVPGVKPVNHIPIKRTAHTDGIPRIAETDNARGVFIVVCRAVKASNPFPVQSVILLLVNIKGSPFRGKLIIVSIITPVIFIHVAHIPFTVAHYHSCHPVRSSHRYGTIGFHYDFIYRSHHYRFFPVLLLHLFLLRLLGRHVVEVVHNLCPQCPREAQGKKR